MTNIVGFDNEGSYLPVSNNNPLPVSQTAGADPTADSGTDVWVMADDGRSPRLAQKVFPDAGVDARFYIMSTDAGDTDVEVEIEGSTTTGVLLDTGVQLNGQTPVAVPTQGNDVNRVRVTAPVTGADGTIYVSKTNSATNGVPDTASDIIAVVNQGKNTTEQSHYTVPGGFTLDLTFAAVAMAQGSGAAGSATVNLLIQHPDEPAIENRVFKITTSRDVSRAIKGISDLPAGTHIWFQVESVSDTDTDIVVTWDYTLNRV